MNTSEIRIISAAGQNREVIVSLLQTEHLPVTDLPPVLNCFWTAIDNDVLVGVIGLERYGKQGLLRSLVVEKNHRNKNIAAVLLNHLEEKAGELGITELYLLTETAADYFARKNFQMVSRADVPDSIKASSEFSSVCPVSATVMRKKLA